jgi:type I restriction enzyme M protein
VESEPNNVVQLIPAGKLRCFVSGKLRTDNPEEHVRQRWARSLVTEYGYDLKDMAVEFRIKMGSGRPKKADIVIFKPGAPQRQENVLIVVEAKRENVPPHDRDEGIEQLKSYMAACSSCRYGLWVGSERLAYARSTDGSIEDAVDIPRAGEDRPRVPQFADLVPAFDLKAAFRRCHNYIYANQGLQKAEAFHELVKLIFAKVYDEKESEGSLRFYVQSEERRSAAGQRRLLDERIAPLFNAVCERYPYIFPSSDKIALNGRVLAYIVSELQSYSLLRTQTDVKGAAYEELVGANLRGDRGEYFTPRNVCDMAVRMVFALYPPRQLTSLKILDTCCGTGGFLVSAINLLRERFTIQETAKGGEENEVVSRVGARVSEIATHNLYGLDINPFLVQTCQMNLVMHGDGSANVFQADSLYSPNEWDNVEAAAKVGYGKFDMVVTNPPFGGKAVVDDPHLLDQYELARIGSREQRSSLPSEQLFVEGAWKFLKPGGFLAIVLPDSILNNPGLRFIRQWLFQRTRVVASVDLPKETFAESGGVPNPSVLIVERLAKEQTRLAEVGALPANDIFMAIPQTAGRDKRGNPIYCKAPDGQEVLDANMELVLDDDLPQVAGVFAEEHELV